MPFLNQFDKKDIFLDANIFLYAFTAHKRFGEDCYGFISKIEKGLHNGITSNLVITEIIHKIMVIETSEQFNVRTSEAVNYLKRYPHRIKKLAKYLEALNLIYRLPNLTIFEVSNKIFHDSHSLIKKNQLLSSDAIHVATCKYNRIQHIATNDRDFERVAGLVVWRPQSL